MTLKLDSQLVTLFGSETRVSVLAALAGASSPFTGYRIAKIADVQPIKAYAELRRLRDAGIVREIPGKKGRSAWELPPGEIRSFVGGRTRLSWSSEWMNSPRRQVTPADRAFVLQIAEAAAKRARPRSIPPGARAILSEMARPPEKDAILERLGLPTSVRRGRR
ncbi:MAG: hypothetical protein ACLPZM_03405 [Thermoplasmata archaeon]